MKNTRLLFTFQNVHALLSAEKALRQRFEEKKLEIKLRATSTPDWINENNSICSMALEILNIECKEKVLEILKDEKKEPTGIHQIDF